MTNQDRYDELDNFISTLRMLKDTLNSKDLIEEIEYLLYNTDYQNEMNRLEEILNSDWDDELNERNKEYINLVLER